MLIPSSDPNKPIVGSPNIHSYLVNSHPVTVHLSSATAPWILATLDLTFSKTLGDLRIACCCTCQAKRRQKGHSLASTGSLCVLLTIKVSQFRRCRVPLGGPNSRTEEAAGDEGGLS